MVFLISWIWVILENSFIVTFVVLGGKGCSWEVQVSFRSLRSKARMDSGQWILWRKVTTFRLEAAWSQEWALPESARLLGKVVSNSNFKTLKNKNKRKNQTNQPNKQTPLTFTEPPQRVWNCARFGGGHWKDVATCWPGSWTQTILNPSLSLECTLRPVFLL